MKQPKHIVIVAGEESGDCHAAIFIRELKARHPDLQISGIGGQHLQDAGVTLISDLAKYAVTGVSEVLKHIRVIRRAFKTMENHLRKTKPDLLVLVDYPGFNLRLLKFAKQTLGIRIVYYISPQIWAWKANRIKIIREYVDHMAVILPFEKTIYQQANVPASFVGHPLMDKIISGKDIPTLKEQLQLPAQKKLIAMLPGSRMNEVNYLMPVLRDTALKLSQTNSNLHFVIPVARTIEMSLIQTYFADTKLSYTLVNEQAAEIVYCSDFAIVASGTASLECALLIKPMCIIYKTSWITAFAATKLMKVKYLGLCNLLQNQMIVPELLQYDCNVEELTRVVQELMTNKQESERMTRRLEQLKHSLSLQQADATISELIEQELAKT